MELKEEASLGSLALILNLAARWLNIELLRYTQRPQQKHAERYVQRAEKQK